MNPQELRLGNKVLFYGEVDTIVEIGQAGNGYCENNRYFNFDKFTVEPIPLTEEWLLKFGFIKEIDDVYVKEVFGAEVSFKTYHADFIFNQIFYRQNKWVLITGDLTENENIQHVHQLQNLYHALTGEELKIVN